MTGLRSGKQTDDGRLVSTETAYTYRGMPIKQAYKLAWRDEFSDDVAIEAEAGPDETEDDDVPEAAE